MTNDEEDMTYAPVSQPVREGKGMWVTVTGNAMSKATKAWVYFLLISILLFQMDVDSMAYLVGVGGILLWIRDYFFLS